MVASLADVPAATELLLGIAPPGGELPPDWRGVIAEAIVRGLVRRGVDARFVATGQTGIMIAGDGCPIDCVVSDFVNGAAERLVLANQHHDVIAIEGQGSIFHPRYSAVTYGLLHGSLPGWPAYKLKLGGDDDLAIARAVRGATDARLRVDASCGWSAEWALAMAEELAGLGVELIEQPLPAGDRAGMERLRAGSPLPLYADEDCLGPADVAACAGIFDGVNIKLVKCGGLNPARRMIAAARECGLAVMVGCMTESTAGIAAAAQLVPLVDAADLDGAVLLAGDTATGVTVDRGLIRLADAAGLGIRVG